MLVVMRYWGKRSKTDKVTLLDIIQEGNAFENILSSRVLELSLTLVNGSIWERNEWEDVESKKAFLMSLTHNVEDFCNSHQGKKQSYFLWIVYQEDHLDKIH